MFYQMKIQLYQNLSSEYLGQDEIWKPPLDWV